MRVSTARQEEEQTVENQFMELKERIELDGNLLLPKCIYKDEAWSGAILERPELDRMRTDAREGKFEILYSYDRGRVSRKFVHQEIVLEELKELKIEYISLHDINGHSPEENLMGGVMSIFHEYEKLKITERMRIGKIRKVKEAKKLLGYNPKYGYDYHHRVKTGANPTDAHFTLNTKQAAVVSQIYEWIAAGYSKHEVRKRLFDDGVMPPKAKRAMWSNGTLDRLVRDSTYCGEHYYNKSESIPTKNHKNPNIKYRKVINGSRRIRPKEEWLLIKVPPIIDKRLFDKVQTQLVKNKRTNPRNNKKNQYLLAGLIECPCGHARTGDPACKGHLYYRCTDRLCQYPLPRKCYEKGVNAHVLDAVVWHQLMKLLQNPKLISQQAKRWQDKASPLKKRVESISTKIKGLDNEERRYTKVYGLGLMSEDLYKEQAIKTNKQRIQLKEELTEVQSQLENSPKLSIEQIVKGTKKTIQNLDLTDKKFIVKKIIDKIVATQKEATIWGHIPVLVTEQVGYEPINRDHWFT
jgi:site-specific DNA recombinase